MIERLEGVLAARGPTSIELGIGPITVSLSVPLSTSRRLPAVGEPVAVMTHLVWKEEGPALFGFAERAERDLFRLLIGVQGVGPTGALSLLSHLPPSELLLQIRARSIEGLTRVPRIGEKTAGRILVDLGPKVDRMALEGDAASVTGQPGALPPVGEDAVQALTALGYVSRDARRTIERILKQEPDLPLDECVRRALRQSPKAGG